MTGNEAQVLKLTWSNAQLFNAICDCKHALLLNNKVWKSWLHWQGSVRLTDLLSNLVFVFEISYFKVVPCASYNLRLNKLIK